MLYRVVLCLHQFSFTKKRFAVFVSSRIAWGKFTNCGQTCIAPDYILCNASIQSRLIEEIHQTLQVCSRILLAEWENTYLDVNGALEYKHDKCKWSVVCVNSRSSTGRTQKALQITAASSTRTTLSVWWPWWRGATWLLGETVINHSVILVREWLVSNFNVLVQSVDKLHCKLCFLASASSYRSKGCIASCQDNAGGDLWTRAANHHRRWCQRGHSLY